MSRALTILRKTITTILVASAVGFALMVAYNEITTSPLGVPPSSSWSFK